MEKIVLGFADSENQSQQLASALGLPWARIDVHHFPDGESRLTLPTEPVEEVIIHRSLDRPNDKLVELFLSSRALRQQGVKKITLVAPYLCYMRQDMAFAPGQVVSQPLIGHWLAQMCDALVTVDPHLHRIHHLKEAVPLEQAEALSAAPLLGRFAADKFDNAMLLGPDAEAEQWVAAAAAEHGLDWGVAHKVRHGDREVVIELPDRDVSGRQVFIIDDVASTGQTVAHAAERLYDAGAAGVHCLLSHALFAPGAEQRLQEAGVKNVWSSDAITHDSNVIALAPLLAGALKKF